LLRKGAIEEAIAGFETTWSQSRNPLPLYSLGQAHAVAGRRDRALEVVAEMRERSKSMYMPAYGFATIYACLGQAEEATAWLERAFDERYPNMILLKAEPAFDAVRSDSRFIAILERVGFPA
jgi:tetratricopeptide (TPR) repeat protein